MLVTRFLFNEIVLQPTSLCNLDCKYCYLPDRKRQRLMLPAVTVEVARTLESLPVTKEPITILWHCGEPLACGLKHFSALIEPFAGLEKAGRVRHMIQTNATLIDERWCEFFRAHNFRVCVSLDGPAWANQNRVDWKGAASYTKIMRGIETLKAAGFPLSVIAVVSQDSLNRAAELYEFFAGLDCKKLSINIEERNGANDSRDIIDEDAAVRKFWQDLYTAWRANPAVSIREFFLFSQWWNASEEKTLFEPAPEFRTNLLPTIAWNGDAVFLSPELLDTSTERYQSFVVGNLMAEPFLRIIKRAKTANYVQDYITGQEECKNTCKYYSFCGGGYASNKFSELGTTGGTETAFCRNSRQRVFDVVYHTIPA